MEYRLGVDLGGTAIKAGVIDGEKRIVSRVSVPTGASRPYTDVAADMAGAAKQAAAQAGLAMDAFAAVGFGMPGFVDFKRGVHVFAGNLGWRNVPIVSELQQYFTIPVRVGNDANCAVVGETVAGAAQGLANVLMLTLGTGVGGGLILDGRLFAGGDGMGAELGHVPLCFGGAPCSCGSTGCLEAYASVTALIRETEAARDRIREAVNYRVETEKTEHVPEITKEQKEKTEHAPKQLDLFEEKLLSPQATSQYRIIGQIFETYWLVEF